MGVLRVVGTNVPLVSLISETSSSKDFDNDIIISDRVPYVLSAWLKNKITVSVVFVAASSSFYYFGSTTVNSQKVFL